MLLIDTSVWINVFRDRTGQVRQKLETLINDRDVLLTRFTQLELLQGSLNEKEWTLLSTYLETLNLHKYGDCKRNSATGSRTSQLFV